MKNFAVLLFLSAFFAGCSNWNIGNEPSVKPSVETQTPTQKPTTTVAKSEEMVEAAKKEIAEPVKTSVTPENKGNMFHINEIVSVWGKPDSVKTDASGNNSYIWKSCKNSEDERTCCNRVLVTDDGYVTNSKVKEAIAKCM